MRAALIPIPLAIVAVGMAGGLYFVAYPQLVAPMAVTEEVLFSFPENDGVSRFVQLRPMNIPMIQDGKVVKIVSLGVTIEVKGQPNNDATMRQGHRLHDAFLRELHGVISIKREDGRAVDPHVVKVRLMAIGERLLGSGVIENILVTYIGERVN